MKKVLGVGLVFLAVAGVFAQQQSPAPTDEQLDILELQADVQKCQVAAAKTIRKLQAQIAELKRAAQEGK